MDEPIAPANLLQKDTVNGVIEEASVIERSIPLNEEDETQGIVLDYVEAAEP